MLPSAATQNWSVCAVWSARRSSRRCKRSLPPRERWFEGKLDFAPNVPHDVGGLQLRGGSVGYFLDRKAAVMSYTLRRHVVTLLAFPANGLPWPDVIGGPDAVAKQLTARGVHVFFWRHGDVAYALVADVGLEELGRVAHELARATAD